MTKKKGKAGRADYFHHKSDNSDINVVEKDTVVNGMPHDELSRGTEIEPDYYPSKTDLYTMISIR